MKMREVCLRTGLTERTVRFYVEQGLLSPAREPRNGRTYLTFSEADVALLDDLATLRRAAFSLGEIAALQTDLSALPGMLAGRTAALREESQQALGFAAALERLDPAAIADLHALAAALRQSPVDAAPRFGRFDPETPRQRDAAYAAFLTHAARRERHRTRLALLAAALALVLASSLTTLAVTGALPHRRPAAAEPASRLAQRYSAAQLAALEGSFRAWLDGASLTEAGIDAVTGRLTANYSFGSCVLTVECEPLAEMACALVDDQSLPLLTLLTHPETPEARIELIVPGGAEHRYFAIYLSSDALTEDEILTRYGRLELRRPWGGGYTVTPAGVETLPAPADSVFDRATPIDALPVPGDGQQLQRFRAGLWRDWEGGEAPGYYRLTDASGAASYYLLGEPDAAGFPEQSS